MTDIIDYTKITALVVEDNDFVRYMVKRHLVGFGCQEVVEAADGFEGLKALDGKKPDVIICDISMEPVNGFDFLKHVRGTDSPHKNLPVIFLTSSAEETSVKKAIAGGVDAYLLKPVAPDDLKQKITRLVKKTASGDS